MTTPALDLRALVFTAKIDFISLHTLGRVPLPPLDGHVVWPRSANGRKVTIQDLSPRDVWAVDGALAELRISELEVCVDVGCAPHVPQEARDDLLQGVMTRFARGLEPDRNGLIGPMRGYFRSGAKSLQPFNLRLPRADDQLLYGHRNDAAQVKAYYKKTDQRRPLPPELWRARVEVALRHDALAAHGLITAHNLVGFRFRRELSRYFRHVRGATLRILASSRTSALRRDMATWSQRHQVDPEFQRVGAGAVGERGHLGALSLRNIRDVAMNDRIGQALLRLEQSMAREIRAQELNG